MQFSKILRSLPLLLGWLCCVNGLTQGAELSILFLGDSGHHQPRARAEQLIPVMKEAGISVTYTEDLEQINLENLKKYSGLLVYANIDEIGAKQESALLEYVAQGGGFIPLHCASYCFRNSPAVVDLMGAQFQRHGGEEFRTEITVPDHPIMQGFSGFESWDETYIHTKHNERNRIVLEVRRQGDQARGNRAEPWTWVRTHGKGRVFYTAWGHDHRTWGHPGFQNLVERGIRWACGDDPSVVADYQDEGFFPIPSMKAANQDVAAFEYEDVGPKIPNYTPGEQWGTMGEAMTLMQKPLSPEESIKHFVVPENFHLELVASEPDFAGKPIAMNWDDQGRMWICETVDYPNELMPPGEGRDRIRVCEDTDGDGRFDSFEIFAENISIPTSIEFYRGGVIVQAGVETLYLRDNDGDGKADQRDVLISGWQMGDTHGGVSNFRFGLDNRYWAMQGYNNSRPRYAGGQHPGFRQGPFNFTVAGSSQAPEVTDVEFVRSTTNNSWGIGISEEGHIFASTANRAPSFYVPIPNRYYEKVRGWAPSLMADEIAPDHYFKPITDKVRQVDQHGGFTAGAGHALYTARNYPPSWWNRTAFVCGPTGHLVGTFVLTPDGTTFKDYNAFNLVASDDEWSAPIMAEVGPDGNIWILDWYNFIVQHNPTPKGFKTGKGAAYESDLRDKTHGRIYRLVYDGSDGMPGADSQPKLDREQPQSLIAALAHPNRLWRRHAQRLLVERGEQDVVPELIQLVQDPSVDSTGNNVGAIHALWVLHGIGALEEADGAAFQAVSNALRHKSAGVRRNAVQVLPSAKASVLAIADAQLTQDAHPQVQLSALLALSTMPASSEAGALLSAAASSAKVLADSNLRDALICASATQGLPFLIDLLNKEEVQPQATQILNVVAEHLSRSGLTADAVQQLLSALNKAPATARAAVIQGLAQGITNAEKLELSSEAESTLGALAEKSDLVELGGLLRLGNAWGSTQLQEYSDQLSEKLFAQIEDEEAAADKRVQAAEQLIELAGNDEDTIIDLLDLVTPQLPPDISSGIIRAMLPAKAANKGEALLDQWKTSTPSLREDIVSVLIARPETTSELLAGMEDGILTAGDLSLDQRQALMAHPDRRIRRQATQFLSSVGEVVNEDRQKVIEEYASVTHEKGNAKVGKELFTKNCASCHKHSGEGKEIGPDLTGMAVHPKEELLIHILDPNRSVEANFRRYTLLTSEGQVMTGMLAAESQAAVQLIDVDGKSYSISREDIERINASNQSLMPEGFEQQIKPEQMRDLLEFLTQTGRFVPLALNKVATAISTKGLFHDGDNGPDRIVFEDWGAKEFRGVPFQLVDPQGKSVPNILLLHGPMGTLPPRMPREVSLPCNMQVQSLHLLSGISGWGYPYSQDKTVSMIVRFHYQDGQTEDHELENGVHFADYIRKVDVPKSEFAFNLRGQQLRYLSVQPKRQVPIQKIDLVKGPDRSAPMVIAVTAERAE